jgi:hypothetical protein
MKMNEVKILNYPSYICIYMKRGDIFITAITKYQVTISTNWHVNILHVVGHERVRSTLFQCIVSIL